MPGAALGRNLSGRLALIIRGCPQPRRSVIVMRCKSVHEELSRVKTDGVGSEVPWCVSAFRVGPQEPGAVELVGQIRRLRARILFDGGRRPEFRDAEQYVDEQDLDFGAWHFVAWHRAGGPPVGYVRLSTPQVGTLFQSRAFLGAEEFELLLLEQGLGAAETFEHSRLVVEHRARKLGLGIHLNAVAVAAARHLGAKAMIGTSGTADGQDRFHERFGFRPVPGTRRYVEHYTEDVVIMLYRAADGAGEHTRLVERLEHSFPAIVVEPGQLCLDEAVTSAPVPPALACTVMTVLAWMASSPARSSAACSRSQARYRSRPAVTSYPTANRAACCLVTCW